MRASDCRLGERVLVTLFIFTISAFSDAAQADAEKGTIWVDMTVPRRESDVDNVINALVLRLPSWSIARIPDAVSFSRLCENVGEGKGYLMKLADKDGTLHVAMFGCNEEAPLWEENIGDDVDSEGAFRRTAVLAGLTVEGGDEAVSKPDEAIRDDKVEDEKIIVNESTKLRKIGLTVAAVPGLTVAPKRGDVVFTGQLNGGAVLNRTIWLELGVLVSAPVRGEADKNSNDAANDISISVQETAFEVSFKYRLVWGDKWWSAIGLGLSYSHFVKRDLADDKFAIEEQVPAARGAVLPALAVCYAPFRFLSVLLSVSLQVSFGPRTFTIRGEDAVDLGTLRAMAGLGLVFFL